MTSGRRSLWYGAFLATAILAPWLVIAACVALVADAGLM